MRKGLMAAGLVVVAGLLYCKSNQASGTIVGGAFSITVQATSMDIKQGQTALARVLVNREEGFRHPIRLEITAPVGLEVDPSSVTLREDERESVVPLRIRADSDAPLGGHYVPIRGTPTIGPTVEAVFQVNVIAR